MSWALAHVDRLVMYSITAYPSTTRPGPHDEASIVIMIKPSKTHGFCTVPYLTLSWLDVDETKGQAGNNGLNIRIVVFHTIACLQGTQHQVFIVGDQG